TTSTQVQGIFCDHSHCAIWIIDYQIDRQPSFCVDVIAKDLAGECTDFKFVSILCFVSLKHSLTRTHRPATIETAHVSSRVHLTLSQCQCRGPFVSGDVAIHH